jgi:hypothetical protein
MCRCSKRPSRTMTARARSRRVGSGADHR